MLEARVLEGWMGRHREAGMAALDHVVSVGVFVRDGRVLMCHRRADKKWYPDVWDFAGGHVEDGETPASALCREAREELGIEAKPPFVTMARWVEGDEDITFFLVREWVGTARNLAPEEHDDVRWLTLAEALQRKLPDPRYRDLLRSVLPET